MNLILVRNLQSAFQGDKNAVSGVLICGDKETTKISTLENINYLVDEGNYILHYEHSPKFNRDLWELYGTGKRSEIKFHLGGHSENSRGCILLGSRGLNMLHDIIDNRENHNLEVRNF